MDWGDKTNKWVKGGQLISDYNKEIFSDAASKEDMYFGRFLARTEFGAAGEDETSLHGVDVIDFLTDEAEYGDFINDGGAFRMTGKGRSMLSEVAGAFNGTFGRNPTVREALLFIKNGQLNVDGDDASLGS